MKNTKIYQRLNFQETGERKGVSTPVEYKFLNYNFMIGDNYYFFQKYKNKIYQNWFLFLDLGKFLNTAKGINFFSQETNKSNFEMQQEYYCFTNE